MTLGLLDLFDVGEVGQTPEEPQFKKYRERGAYHWGGVYPRYLWRYQPQLDANYEVALVLLRACLPQWEGLRVVDIGCGDAVLLYKLWRSGVMPIGVDLERSGLRLAQRELHRRGMISPCLVQATVYALPFPSASIDGAVAVEVLEHLEDPSRFLVELQQVLKPSGVFVLTTPKGKHDGSLHSQYHFHEYLADELYELLEPYFKCIEVYGFPLRYVSLLYRLGGPPGKLLIKAISRYVFNPFASPVRAQRDTDCENLVAVCWR